VNSAGEARHRQGRKGKKRKERGRGREEAEAYHLPSLFSQPHGATMWTRNRGKRKRRGKKRRNFPFPASSPRKAVPLAPGKEGKEKGKGKRREKGAFLSHPYRYHPRPRSGLRDRSRRAKSGEGKGRKKGKGALSSTPPITTLHTRGFGAILGSGRGREEKGGRGEKKGGSFLSFSREHPVQLHIDAFERKGKKRRGGKEKWKKKKVSFSFTPFRARVAGRISEKKKKKKEKSRPFHASDSAAANLH